MSILLHAVIYILTGKNFSGRLARCWAYCEACGYVVVGVVTGPDNWADVEALLDAGDADVAVLRDRAELPERPRYPVVEYADPGCR